MISIADIISSDRIQLNLRERKKKQIVFELSKLIDGEVSMDTASLAKQILKREKMASTGIGHGVAIPHVLTEAVAHTIMAFGRSKTGVPFDSADNRPVHLFFLIVGPKNSTPAHLKILSKLSRMVTQEEFRRRLLEAESPEEIIEIMRAEEES